MNYIELFFVCVKVGFFCFGGLSMLPLISEEMLNHGWMTMKEISDIVAIAEMTPGAFGINCATFVGMRTGGLPGAIIATTGVMMPSLTLCMIAGIFIVRLKDNRYLGNALYGIRPVCVGMMFATILSLCQTTFIIQTHIYLPPILIACIIYVLLEKFHLSIPKAIIAAALLGLVFA